MSHRIYVSGPITGHDDYNEPAFRRRAETIEAAGHEAVVPHDLIDGDYDKTWQEYMRLDLKALLDCDAITMLHGWEKSRGARLELHVAQAVGIFTWMSALANAEGGAS